MTASNRSEPVLSEVMQAFHSLSELANICDKNPKKLPLTPSVAVQLSD